MQSQLWSPYTEATTSFGHFDLLKGSRWGKPSMAEWGSDELGEEGGYSSDSGLRKPQQRRAWIHEGSGAKLAAAAERCLKLLHNSGLRPP
jgi:hypothetical protein